MDFRRICQNGIRERSNVVLRSMEIQFILCLIKKYQEENDSPNLSELYWQLGYRENVLPHGYDLFMNFMESAGSYKQRDYFFCYDYETDRIAMEYLGGKLIPVSHSFASRKELESYLENMGLDNLRFCSVCGAPMQSGYIDEKSYFDTDLEFYNHMNQLYGHKKWRLELTGKEEWDYEYFDEEHETWELSPFYRTEW